MYLFNSITVGQWDEDWVAAEELAAKPTAQTQGDLRTHA